MQSAGLVQELSVLFIYYFRVVFQHSDTHFSLFTLIFFGKEVPVVCLLAKHCAHPDKGVKAARPSLFPPRAIKHTHDILSPRLDAKESDSTAREELAVRFIVEAEGAWNPTSPTVWPLLGGVSLPRSWNIPSSCPFVKPPPLATCHCMSPCYTSS